MIKNICFNYMEFLWQECVKDEETMEKSLRFSQGDSYQERQNQNPIF